ncbi:hypothetical protein [Streptomyces sp. NPDC005423]|uniref:hypothetical protein n=1 Tax=Streptomyces sp. NPDC005423 TaxID=3155343 RepID=UPI0033A5F178
MAVVRVATGIACVIALSWNATSHEEVEYSLSGAEAIKVVADDPAGEPAPLTRPGRTLRRPQLTDGQRAAIRRAGPALMLFAAVRLTGVAMLTGWALRIGRHPSTVLGLEWDSKWYWRIAEHGYGVVRVHGSHGSIHDDRAFFPLYPAMIHAFDAIVPVGKIDAALLIAWTGALAAAWGVFAVGDLLYGRRVGTALAVLWAVLPHAVVLTVAYTEPVMTAFAAWALYAVLTGRRLTAGGLAALAGLCRPNGLAVAAAVVTALTIDARQRCRAGRMVGARTWAAALLAPAGWVGYVVWVAVDKGAPTGYLQAQATWGSRFDFGHYTARILHHLIVHQGNFANYLAAAISLAALVLLVLCVLAGQPLPLLVYNAVLLVMALGTAHYFPSRPRLLLPAFPILLPLAVPLARARLRTAMVLLSATAGFSLLCGVYLFGIASTAP